MTPRRRVRYLQRNLSVHLYRIPRQTGAGILDAQSGSKAYLGVQNHTPLDRDIRTKIRRKLPYHSHRKKTADRNDAGPQCLPNTEKA